MKFFNTLSLFLLLLFFSVCHAGNCLGKTFTFGMYELNESVLRSPLMFTVIDERDHEVLVICQNGIDVKPFNTKDTEVTWEDCSLRKWLNEEFLINAFSFDERQYIVKSSVLTSPNRLYPNKKKIFETEDYIFLLDEVEAELYFLLPEDRIAIMSDRIKNLVFSDENGYGDWWLRTSGGKLNRAVYVRDSGDIFYGGSIVTDDAIAVRPAFWIKKSYFDFVD